MMSIVEYHLPKLWKLYNTLKLATGKSVKDTDKASLPQWVRDFKLAEWGNQGLFYEYLEMGKRGCNLILARILHFAFSDPIRVRHHIRVCLPFGSFLCFAQQHFRAQVGR